MEQDLNILQVNSLSKYFGGLAAVSNCSLKIRKGSVTGVIDAESTDLPVTTFT